MYGVIIILFVVSLLLLALAIVKPNLVLFWKTNAQPNKAMKLYGLITFFFFILLIIFSPTSLPDFAGDDLDSLAAAHASQVEELEEIYPKLPSKFDRFQQLINKSDTAVLQAFLIHRGYYKKNNSTVDIVYNWDSLSKLNSHRLLMELRNRMCAGYEPKQRYHRELAYDVTSTVFHNTTEQASYAKLFLKEDYDRNRFSKFRILTDELNGNSLSQYPVYVNFNNLLLSQITAAQLVDFFEINNYIHLEKKGSVEHYKTFPELLPSSEETLKKWEEILQKDNEGRKLLLDHYAAIQVIEERLKTLDTL